MRGYVCHVIAEGLPMEIKGCKNWPSSAVFHGEVPAQRGAPGSPGPCHPSPAKTAPATVATSTGGGTGFRNGVPSPCSHTMAPRAPSDTPAHPHPLLPIPLTDPGSGNAGLTAKDRKKKRNHAAPAAGSPTHGRSSFCPHILTPFHNLLAARG